MSDAGGRALRRWAGLAAGLVLLPVAAVQAAGIGEEARQEAVAVCSQPLQIEGHNFFPDMTAAARQIRADFCNFSLTQSAALQRRIVSLAIDAEPAFTSLPSLRSFDYAGLVAAIESAVSQARGVPNLNRRSLGGPGIILGDHAFVVESSEQCDAEVATIAADADCGKYIADFVTIFNHAQNTLAGPLAGATANHLERLGREWDHYFETARSQTSWEMALNGALFQRSNEQYRFLPPPDMQVILLHPSLALEHVSDAPDGSETKEALMLEIIGANWWRQDKWYVPSGAALVATYSDRARTDDWALGAALHFSNDFTIGYSERDGDGGIFLSLDLWQAFQSKRSMIERYRGSLTSAD